MRYFWEVFVWVIIISLLAILTRLILVENTCDEVVSEYVGDTIPRSIRVNASGDFLTGECSYKMISKSIKVP
jgi:hypothetical protein